MLQLKITLKFSKLLNIKAVSKSKKIILITGLTMLGIISFYFLTQKTSTNKLLENKTEDIIKNNPDFNEFEIRYRGQDINYEKENKTEDIIKNNPDFNKFEIRYRGQDINYEKENKTEDIIKKNPDFNEFEIRYRGQDINYEKENKTDDKIQNDPDFNEFEAYYKSQNIDYEKEILLSFQESCEALRSKNFINTHQGKQLFLEFKYLSYQSMKFSAPKIQEKYKNNIKKLEIQANKNWVNFNKKLIDKIKQ